MVDIFRLFRGTKHHYRQPFEFRSALEPIQDVESVHARHFQIQQQKPWHRISPAIPKRRFASQVIHRLLAVSHEMQRNRDADFGKSALQEKSVRRIVLRYQNASSEFHSVTALTRSKRDWP